MPLCTGVALTYIPHACPRPHACGCRSAARAETMALQSSLQRPGSPKTCTQPKPNTIHTVARSGEAWDKAEALRAVLLGLIVQAAANVNNTYWDFVSGVDTATVSLLCATLFIINMFQFHNLHVLSSPRCRCSVWCLCLFLLATWPGFRAVVCVACTSTCVPCSNANICQCFDHYHYYIIVIFS